MVLVYDDKNELVNAEIKSMTVKDDNSDECKKHNKSFLLRLKSPNGTTTDIFLNKEQLEILYKGIETVVFWNNL